MQKVTTQEMIVLLNEIREQAVAAVVERGDGEERDPAMDMLARKVQIINAIAERVREMTAVEFARTVFDAWHSYYDDDFAFAQIVVNKLCEDPNVAVEIVKRWKEEHK